MAQTGRVCRYTDILQPFRGPEIEGTQIEARKPPNRRTGVIGLWKQELQQSTFGCHHRRRRWSSIWYAAKKVQEAQKILTFNRKYSAGVVGKLLKSAVANAKENPNIDENILYVKKIYVDQGPSLKTVARPRPGTGSIDQEEDEPITIVLDEA